VDDRFGIRVRIVGCFNFEVPGSDRASEKSWVSNAGFLILSWELAAGGYRIAKKLVELTPGGGRVF